MSPDQLLEEHRRRVKPDGYSEWSVQVHGRKRKFKVLEFQSRLYTATCMYHGTQRVIQFEEPLSNVILRWGDIT
jgi:hypothetical protein